MSNRSPVGAHHHITPVKIYVVTLVSLLILMTLTVVAAQFSLPGGTLTNNLVAMGIACMKASLVIMIFMGVAYSSHLARLWSVVGFLWLVIAFGILIDYKTRIPIEGPYHDAGSALREGKAIDLAPTPGDTAIDKRGVPKSHE